MASKADIQAGGAFIRLFVKDAEFKKGLAAAQTGLRSFASGVATVGIGLAAAGGAVLAGITKSLTHFADVGGELNDMSLRTGVAGNKLAFFRYAAEQTGASIEDIEAAIKHAAKHGFSPENFEQLALEIARIEDPTKRAARAMELFGKGGTKLLPMFGELADLRGRWEQLGISPSEESIALADELGDLWGDLKATLASVAYEIGAAVAPAAKALAEALVPIVVSLNQWIKKNPELVTGIAAIAAAMLIIGTALASTAAVLAPIVGMVAALFTWGGLVVVLIAAGVAQLALFLAGAVLLIAALVRWTNIGRMMFSMFLSGFKRLTDSISKSMKGILDALRAGDMQLAWDIAIADMTMRWFLFAESVLGSIADINEALVHALSPLFADLILGSDSSLGGLARDLSEAAGSSATTERMRRDRLMGQASRRAGDRGNPEDPGYGLPARNAAIVGTNARAAIMSRQVIGGGRNAVQDLLTKILGLQTREEQHLAKIARNSRPPRVR